MSPRGRPRKTNQLELPTLENPNADIGEATMEIKHIVRGINKKGMWTQEGDMPVEAVEQYLNDMFSQGWQLKEVYMLQNTPDYINLLYILVR